MIHLPASFPRIFIGFDPREAAAFHVLHQSIIARCSVPISVTAVALSSLSHWYQRERDPAQSTDFAFSRFLIPALCDYEGWAIFMDCDMLVQRDVAELWALRDPRYAVRVVKHDYSPSTTRKFLGQAQTTYAKKNWSSVMLFNNERCRALTPEFVNTASGLQLHQFKWLASESLIGDLPAHWNHLVGEQVPDPARPPVNAHFTVGGPYFSDYAETVYANEWRQEAADALRGLEPPTLDRVADALRVPR